MQRRSLLKVSLAGAVALSVGGGAGLALWPGDTSVRPQRPLLSLPERAFPVLVAVAARVLKGTTANPVEIAHRVDEALRYATPESRSDLADVFGLLENGLTGLMLRGQPRPFTLLDERAQDEALLAWRDSRVGLLRGAYHALRKLCLAAHYATPSSWAEVGYGGPAILKPEPPPLAADKPVVVDGAARSVEGMPG
ncbi:MAG: hypothetical protein FJ137_07480 [Deltaproteobacteria bacterium]|nr:hypothetical protein [Deltaproteobacteria bacterium]